MPKIAYTEKEFRESTLTVIDQANEIIEEYSADGLKLTLRQLYYQFVARGMIANKQSEYKRLGGIISDARLAGLIDWIAIEDRTRNLQENTHWEDPGEIIRSCAYGFQLDHWQNQNHRIEVWIEKEALIGVIDTICKELDVSFFACKGYVSQSEMWAAAMRLKHYSDHGKQPVIIHLGDHDPSGIDMTRDIFDRNETFLVDVEVERIALNMDQIEEFDPPPNPAKLSDSRAHKYIRQYGKNSWELDALEPRYLRHLIEETVLKYRDQEFHNDIIDQENEYLETLDRIERNWQTL